MPVAWRKKYITKKLSERILLNDAIIRGAEKKEPKNVITMVIKERKKKKEDFEI